MKSERNSALSLVNQFLGPLLTIADDTTVLTWNEAAERIFGYTAAEAIGKPYIELLVPDEHVEESRKWIKIGISRGSASYDSVKKTKGGALLDVEVVLRVAETGGPRGTILAINIRDITQLKYVRQGKLLEARFRGLLEAAPDAMVIIEPNGRIVLVNRQA